MSTLVLGSYQYQVVPTEVNGWNLTVSVSNTIPALSGGSGAPSGTPTYGSGTIYIDTASNNLWVYTTAWNQIAASANNITIAGTTNQVGVVIASGTATVSIASNPVIPGTASMTLPLGTTAQRPTVAEGLFRYNTTEDVLEGYSVPYTTTGGPIAFQRTEIYRKRLTWEDDFTNGVLSNTTGASGFGQLNWTMTATGTPANTQITAIVDHPGILSLGTGGTNGITTRLHMGNTANTGVTLPNQVEYFAFLIRIPTITSLQVSVGMGQDISSLTFGTDGVWFQFNPATSANLQFTSRAGGTAQATPTNTVTVAANTWYLCEAFYNGTTWTPVVNGVQYTALTTQLPTTTAVNVGVLVDNTAAAAHTLHLDYFAMYTRELGARYP